MLGQINAVANVAVRDLGRARAFYEKTLGLSEVEHMGDEVSVLKSGDTVINVYRSDYAGTNKATSVTWAVGDRIDGLVDELRSKGVAFEHYDMPDVRLEGDVHVFGDLRVAWFKDPDGNILNLINQ
ncbi:MULTISPECIES: VOC family protein [Aminobacter]|jgi:catechol 2,3-dioxygenase-like lactoylglutathione lyase family enzyme|uniref:Catechol 2,3-dioxygenase-like lactoylglutathione lyase family enzyme n=2 Tax=Aminobacter TaxID=31988 RepID=A0AAC9ATJ2_AMIAI|nr:MULTISPECIES: VOC family protein [Aminobacter]AMS44296.1 glyoxalase [Aminobacter aminovorans]MBA8909259.1 catechol 2,3-dioxygenase-like lactoylglutathione lyase family enzyme [Aminobacter ciceronei]MBA9023031.1 catechol 2,3-dioxygenase-like lactoylglutathione lyase family enzyme [Aminobacter ciceronei]MBB3709496.1 catechol 2,3-dioxygenase-like lactoylglutathione lyase family enzyme [Aminobacter aminovorans]MRX36495.1 VOC family protein [Aminobacter sp. MDW-2]